MSTNGRYLNSKILSTRKFKSVLAAGITEEYLSNPDDRAVFRAIREGYTKYGGVPSLQVMCQDFAGYRFIKVEDELPAIIDRVLRDRVGSVLSLTINSAAELYNAGDFELAQQAIEQGVATLNTARSGELVYLDLLALADKWKNDRDNQADGVPFGVGPIDDETGGVYPDQLVTLIGPPGSGKSAHLLRFAISATKSGHKVLFITIEMSSEHHMARAISNATGAVTYREIRRGPMDEEQEEIVADALQEIHDKGLLVIQEIPAGLASLATIKEEILRHSPDVVYIDGAYLMQLPDVRNNAANWERLSALTREMKDLILSTQRPVVITTQVLESKMQGGEVTSKSVGYASSFHQDSDIMIGVQPDPEIPDQQLLKVLKFRDGNKITTRITWDWDRFDFTVNTDEGY